MKSWFSGTASAVNTEIIAPFSNAEQIIYKYNQAVEHNSLTQQGWQRLIAQCDDGLASYLTNIKGTTASMSAYSVSLQGSITGYTKITAAMKQYNALGAVSQKEQQNFATAVSLTNTKLGSYLTGLNGAKASLGGYGISLVASTAKTVGLTIATTALNAALTFGISAIVTGVISAFATWINTSKKVTEAAEEAKDKISSINDDLKTNSETVENTKQRYAELAQEVENLGKVSQSQGSLSTDEYKEFLDLSNQLASVFPQLTKGYDDNGNAILDLSGSVDTIVGSLDDLLQKEKDLANQKIMDEFPDVYKGYIKDLGDAQAEVKSAKAEFDKVNNAYQQLQNSGGAAQAFDLQGNGTFENADGEQVKVTLAEYEQALKDLGIEYEKTNIMVKNQFGGDTLSGYLINTTGDIDTAFTNKLETAKKNLDYAKQQLEGETSSIGSYLNTWLQTEFTYNQIDDTGLQTAVQDMIMNFDFSSLPKDKRNNWEYVSEYLRRNILFAINDVQDDPDISKAISEVFTNQDLTPDEKADYLKQIKDYFDNELGKDNAISIALQPQIDDTDALQKSYEKTINRFKDSNKIKDFFDTEGINTDEEINQFNEVTKGINDADLAIQKWNEHKKEGNETPSSLDLTSLLTESDDKGTSTATLADLQSEADLLKTIQKEMSETDKIGVSSMQSIIKQYPEAKEALSEYMAGIINEQELFAKLEEVYEDDKNAYANKIYEQMETTTQFLENISRDYPDFFDFLSDLYQDDLGNYTTVAELKKEIDTALVSALDSLWGSHYQLVQDKATGLYNAIIDDQAMLDGTISAEESDSILNGISDEVDRANSALARLNEIKNSYVNRISDDASWQSLGKDSSSSSSSKETAEKFNWIEPLIDKISKKYNRLKNIVSDTTSTWLKRNNALSDSMNTLSDEINAQKQAYEYYMNAFNSYGLDSYWKDQIENGSISIDVIYDDDLKDAISDCQDFYDKAQDAKDAVQELNIEIRQLAKTRFDNVASQFEGVIGKVTAIRDLYGKEDDLMQEQGWFSSTVINESMIEQEQKNLERLEAEKEALTKALNSAVSSGKIAPESEDWYSMQASIDDVTSSIFDAKKALVEYDNAIRQINWDAFDRTRDDVSNLIDETEFLVGLLKDKGITDDNGNITNEGNAAQALIAQKYQLYLNQAQAYKDEILKIDEELAKDPYDKELLDRKHELIKAQQDSTNSAIDEKNAIKDLVNDGLTAWSDKLSELIDKYKDLMTQQKNAHDYEKTIAEKTKALNALQKQYSAYQGDNSEEGKKNIQQLKDQINTAKDDLSDTQYEQLISDTEKLLDNLQDEAKTWIDERLDNIDQLMQDIIEQSNTNASNIAETITTTANDYGIKLSDSMANIWSTSANNITGSINSVLGDFSNKFVEGNNAINTVCGQINSAVQGLLANSNAEAQRVADEIARQQAEQNANTDGGYSDSGSSGGNDYNYDNYWDNSSSDDGGSSGSWGDWFYHLEDSYPKNLLEVDTSIVDRLKSRDIDSSFGARADYYSAMGGDGEYYGSADQNIWMIDEMRNHGYRKGTKSATAGVHLTDEDGLGSEAIITKYGVLRQLNSGDTVFNKEQVQELWDMSNGITPITPNMGLDNIATKLPEIPSNNSKSQVDVNYGNVDLHFNLPNVHNYEEFMKKAQRDPKFESMIQEMTLGQTLGHNSLNKLTFR